MRLFIQFWHDGDAPSHCKSGDMRHQPARRMNVVSDSWYLQLLLLTVRASEHGALGQTRSLRHMPRSALRHHRSGQCQVVAALKWLTEPMTLWRAIVMMLMTMK